MTTEEEVEGPTSSWGLRNRITLLTLQEHDDDDDDGTEHYDKVPHYSFQTGNKEHPV